MRRGLKYALVFTGGVAVGVGVCWVKLISYALSDEDIRDGIKNKISRKIDKSLYGEHTQRRNTSYVSYYDYARNKERRTSRELHRSVKDILWDTRKDAEDALDRIHELIYDYGFVSVADICDIANVPCCYADNKYGWTKRGIQDAIICAGKDGYIIDLPKPFPLE